MPALLQTMREGAGTQHPEEIINFLTSRFVLTSGIWDSANNEFLVEESDTPAMSVDIRQGFAFLRNSSAGMVYPIRLTTEDATIAISSNSSGNSRIDAIVLYQDLGASPNAAVSNVAKLIAVEGTPAASPSAPDATAIETEIGASNPYTVLAYVTVESGETTILDADISDQRADATYSEKITPASLDTIYRQAIINGNFDVWQRGTSFVSGANNDDVYTADRWNLVSDGNDVLDVSQEAITDLAGSNYAIKLDVETSARAGIVQFLEAKDAQKFKGKTVSVSFAVKSANISAIRAAVLSWGGTADTITSDIVSSWAATPTWAANWTAENTPSDLAVTSDWTTVTIEGIEIDSATVNNLALAIWLPNAETIGDIIYITQVQLCANDKALAFQPKRYDDELKNCKRYFRAENLDGTRFVTNNFDTSLGFADIHFDTDMRIAPTRTFPPTMTDPIRQIGGSGSVYWGIGNDADGGINAYVTQANFTIARASINSVGLKADLTINSGYTARGYFYLNSSTGSPAIYFNAEL